MNGAQLIISTLVANGVDVAFANPGTSEMHFVAALDDVPEMRGILGLFEGVVTGAADGYGRIAGKPASTLLHLGPGLANGLANLHNARRARTPVLNIVGDHASYHKRFDPPLESDIDSLASPMSGWVHRCEHIADLGTDVEAAIVAAFGPPRRVATLVVPADLSWLETGEPSGAPRLVPHTHGSYAEVEPELIEGIAKALRAPAKAALFIGGTATRKRGVVAADRVARASGAKLLCETFPAVLDRGAGVPDVERLAYLAEFAQMQLEGIETLVLVDSTAPVSFFAYPGKPSDLVPPGCTVHVLATGTEDAPGALEALAELLENDQVSSGDAAPVVHPVVHLERPMAPTGSINAQGVANAIGATLPEGAIVSDEANTAGIYLPAATEGCPPHQWLTLTGGAIGQGMPVATGAAVAAPGRRVLSLEADGSAMYTFQSLWTQARESLDVTTVIFDNHSYGILEMELSRVGADAGGPLAKRMLELDSPSIDFVALARGMGVPSTRASSGEELTEMLSRSYSEPGPTVIVVDIGKGMS